MEDAHKAPIDPADDLNASNELLRLKLELDHKLIIEEFKGLDPVIENQWLTHVYKFENEFKESKPKKVRELLGYPIFPTHDMLTEEEINKEYSRLQSLMEDNDMVLECCCDYDERILYRFITEELFEHETNDISLEGMTRYFIYEEFHPNHDHDLRRLTTGFVDSLLNRKWDEELDAYILADTIYFQEMEYDPAGISSIVLMFQEANGRMEVQKIEIEMVNVNLDKATATAEVCLAYRAKSAQQSFRLCMGKGTVRFQYDNGDWNIDAFSLPGLGDNPPATT